MKRQLYFSFLVLALPILGQNDTKMNGFENVFVITELFKQQKNCNIGEYLGRFSTWRPLYENQSGNSLWYFTPGKSNRISADSAIQFNITTDVDQVWTLTFPSEKMLINFIEQLAESKEFKLSFQDIIEGTQHFRYSSKEIVIEIGQNDQKSNYLVFYTDKDFRKKERLTH